MSFKFRHQNNITSHTFSRWQDQSMHLRFYKDYTTFFFRDEICFKIYTQFCRACFVLDIEDPFDLFTHILQCCFTGIPLQWRYNEHDGVSNHRRFDYLLERWFKCKSKKTSKPRVTGLSERNPPVTGGCPHKGPVMRKGLHFMTSSFPLEIPGACTSTMEETVKHILNFCKTHHKPHCIKGRDRQVITIYRYCEM